MVSAASGRTLGFLVERFFPTRLIWFFARRFIAGRNLNSALYTAKRLNKSGFHVSMDYIGEELKDCDEIQRVKVEYLSLLDAMKTLKVRGDISLKLSHFGLLQENAPHFVVACGQEAFGEILASAASFRVQVWVDAERLAWRKDTWSIVSRFENYHRWMGICIQAYAEDACDFLAERFKEGLCGSESVSIRVCKGAYHEPDYATLTGGALEDNFLELCRLVFENGNYLQIATNNGELLRKAGDAGFGPREYALLLGVNFDIAKKLLKEDKHVKIYTPYGRDVKSYVARRIAERPEYVFLPFRRT